VTVRTEASNFSNKNSLKIPRRTTTKRISRDKKNPPKDKKDKKGTKNIKKNATTPKTKTNKATNAEKSTLCSKTKPQKAVTNKTTTIKTPNSDTMKKRKSLNNFMAKRK
jgi:hypothetical protein